MSRTDKTQPFQIRLWDGTLHRTAVHNHADGICDLPHTLAETLAQYDAGGGFCPPGACFWVFQYTGIKTCGCGLCRDSAGLRAERRNERHRVRRELNDALKAARTGVADLD